MQGSVLKTESLIGDFFGFDLIRYECGSTIDSTINHEFESSIYIIRSHIEIRLKILLTSKQSLRACLVHILKTVVCYKKQKETRKNNIFDFQLFTVLKNKKKNIKLR